MLDTTVRRARVLFPALALISLAGCQSEPSAGHDETSTQVAAQVAPLGPPPADHPRWNPQTNIGIGGDGCPKGVASLLPYRDGFDIVIPNGQLVSKGNKVADNSCVVSTDLPGAPGWQYALRRVRVVGRRTLPKGAVQVLHVDLSLDGHSQEESVKGDGAAVPNARFGRTYYTTPRWSTCGASYKHSMRAHIEHMVVSEAEATSQIERIMVDFTWRRCS